MPELTDYVPKTTWVRGENPYQTKRPGRVTPEEWLELVRAYPGATRAELEDAAPYKVNENIANHALKRLELGGWVRSEQVRRRVGASGIFVMKIWYPTRKRSKT
jgi:hypothetical protein